MTTAGLLWRQFRFERRLFWRNPSAAFFNFLLPLILLLLVASAFAGDADELEVLIPGIAGMGVMATTFTALAFNLTYLREQGVLKRMRGTPLPAPAYLGGLLANAAVNAVVQVALVVAIGNLLYDVPWPKELLSLAVFTALGVVCFGSLGVAFSHAIPNFDSAPAYVNAVFLPVIFISGVFYSADSLPPVLDAAAQALPLKHLVDGLSGAIVDGTGLVDNAAALAAVGAWAAAGMLLAVRYFRWE
ncbi:MAG TPA: ABC transporter permease [Thermoleophilaceae bacterium]|nr:ABC transporter permease [Thermoleophilaceae bacterium]